MKQWLGVYGGFIAGVLALGGIAYWAYVTYVVGAEQQESE